MEVTYKALLISIAALVSINAIALQPCMSDQNSSEAIDAANGVIKKSKIWIHSRTDVYAVGAAVSENQVTLLR
jgi:hypothetical protein